MNEKRCEWSNKISREYHDKEWGTPKHDERMLFEMLILEGMQAGLSWDTILRKRENFKKAFDNFDVKKVANYDEDKIAELLNNEGIIRNRLKVRGAVKNAKAFIKVQEEYGSFDKFIWSYVDNKTIHNSWKSMEEIPANNELSDKISKDLKKLGFTFVGTTIMYAYMQSIGMINDHEIGCFRYDQIKKDQ